MTGDNHVFKGRDQIRDAYRDDGVARNYIRERFREPLGALLHERQTRALRDALNEDQPHQVLELAPGPGRITTDIVGLPGVRGVVVEASAQMLAEARKRVEPQAGGRWSFVHADGFHLPFGQSFDAAYTFRLIRHFDDGDRARVYKELARVLKPGGLLVFDAVNIVVSARVRAKSPGDHQHFDALMTPERLAAELREAGFSIPTLQGVQYRYETLYRLQTLVAPRSRRLARAAMELVDRVGGGEPLEWVVTCRRV